MLEGLQSVLVEVQSDTFVIKPTDEDVHTAIERRLTELIGPIGGKVHTGRSRNDQVATDFTLWIIQAIDILDGCIVELQQALKNRAKKDLGIIMPGLTHTQQSQPVYLSHWWLSYFWPLVRDRERFSQIKKRAQIIPLGSGAMAGTPYPIDRAALAKEFGDFDVSQNSIDAVSNRDSAAEFLFAISLTAVHLSKLASHPDPAFLLWIWLFHLVRCLYHRIKPDAAEEEPGHTRTDAGKSRHDDRAPGWLFINAQRSAIGL